MLSMQPPSSFSVGSDELASGATQVDSPAIDALLPRPSMHWRASTAVSLHVHSVEHAVTSLLQFVWMHVLQTPEPPEARLAVNVASMGVHAASGPAPGPDDEDELQATKRPKTNTMAAKIGNTRRIVTSRPLTSRQAVTREASRWPSKWDAQETTTGSIGPRRVRSISTMLRDLLHWAHAPRRCS